MVRKLKTLILITVKPFSAGQGGCTEKGHRAFSLHLHEAALGHCCHRSYVFPSQSISSVAMAGATVTPFTHLVSPGKDRCLCKDYIK